MAARIEGKAPLSPAPEDDLKPIEQGIAECCADQSQQSPAERIHTFETLLRGIDTGLSVLKESTSFRHLSTDLSLLDERCSLTLQTTASADRDEKVDQHGRMYVRLGTDKSTHQNVQCIRMSVRSDSG